MKLKLIVKCSLLTVVLSRLQKSRDCLACLEDNLQKYCRDQQHENYYCCSLFDESQECSKTECSNGVLTSSMLAFTCPELSQRDSEEKLMCGQRQLTLTYDFDNRAQALTLAVQEEEVSKNAICFWEIALNTRKGSIRVGLDLAETNWEKSFTKVFVNKGTNPYSALPVASFQDGSLHQESIRLRTNDLLYVTAYKKFTESPFSLSFDMKVSVEEESI